MDRLAKPRLEKFGWPPFLFCLRGLFLNSRRSAMSIRALSFLIVSCAMIASDTPNGSAAILYYNDGSVDDFFQKIGDVGVGVPYNDIFMPGGFMDGTSDDGPPQNLNNNKGIIFLKGAAGGVNGGLIRIRRKVQQKHEPEMDKPQMIAVPIAYGSAGGKKLIPRPFWLAAFRSIAKKHLDEDVFNMLTDSEKEEIGKAIFAEGTQFAGRLRKLKKYIGDPFVNPPPVDVLQSELDPINLTVIQDMLATDDATVVFLENTGTRPIDFVDVLIGDLGIGPGFEDLMHHIPFLAILDGVGPSDFGIAVEDAIVLQVNGDSLPGTEPFDAELVVGFEDPVPEPEAWTLSLLALGMMMQLRPRRRAK